MHKSISFFPGTFRDPLFRFVLLCLLVKLFLFTSLTELGIESTIPTCGSILAVLAPVFLMRNERLKLAYVFLWDFLFSLLFFTHALYFKYFGDFASLYDLPQIHQLRAVADMIPGMITVEALFFADLPFLPFIRRARMKQEHSQPLGVKKFLVFLFAGVLLNLPPLYYDYKSSNSYFASIYNRHDFVMRMGIIDYQADDAYDYLDGRLKKASVTRDDIQAVRNWKEERKSGGGNGLTGAGKGMNLVVIQVESMQNFVIGLTHDGREVTPNLNRLAREGLYFRNIFDQTAAGNSSDAVLLANASLYPSRRGAASFLYAQDHFDSLPKLLAQHGYATAAMEAYRRHFWNYEDFDGTLGFKIQVYEDGFAKTDELGGAIRGLSDKASLLQAADKIETLSRPFYVCFRTLSTHAPFNQITEADGNFPLGALDGEIIGYYLRAMHYVDSAIGLFLNKLSENHLLSNTVIVIYGDHRARLPRSELVKAGITDMQEERKIPLIISLPGRRKGVVSSTFGGLIDVAPTVSNILGIDVADTFFLGRDLGNDATGFVIFRDGSHLGGGRDLDDHAVREQLTISDLILEKDVIPLIRGGKIGPR